MKIVFTREVREYLKDLTYITYNKEYFSFLFLHKNTWNRLSPRLSQIYPIANRRLPLRIFGKYSKDMHDSMFRKSRNIHWYVFFNLFEDEKGEYTYIISYTTNNHVITSVPKWYAAPPFTFSL